MKSLAKDLLFGVAVLFAVLLIWEDSNGESMAGQAAGPDKKVRPPAVAGRFYSDDPAELRSRIKEDFRKTPHDKPHPRIKAILAPHAGLVYCGESMGAAYKPLKESGFPYETVFLVGPSHGFRTAAAALSSADAWDTPLGPVRVDVELCRRIAQSHGRIEFDDRAHAGEHALEVQLPYLIFASQGKRFKIVPILISSPIATDHQILGDTLVKFASGPKSLVVISTDLSHFPPAHLAEKVDRRVLEAVTQLDPMELKRTDSEIMSGAHENLVCSMCGLDGVLGALRASKGLGIDSARIVSYTHSGLVSGDNDRVVGYSAVLFFSEGKKKVAKMEHNRKNDFSPEAEEKMLEIARKAVEIAVKGKRMNFVEVDHPELQESLGCFVTLKDHGQLRGCIGRFTSEAPLWKTIQEMAVAAATKDFRFMGNPITPEELGDISVEISALSAPEEVADPLKEIELGRDGIIVEKGANRGTFLPQVATETGWSLEEFLGHCARDKAGIGWDGWKDPDTKVYRYTATIVE